jgi:guanylate kinase
VDYCFKERAEIQRLYGLGQMVEMTEYHGNLYGTPLSLVEEIVNQAEIRSVILDRVGAEKIRQLFGDRILLVGVKATRADCERRLEARGHGAAEIGVRLSSFEEEVEALSDCDIILNNTDANRDKVDALTACIREGLVNRA